MPVSRSQMERLLRTLEAPVRREIERAVRQSQGRINLKVLEAGIRAGDLEMVMRGAGIREGMWSQVTEAIRKAYMEAGIFTLASDLPKRLAFDFNINNPRAESWLRTRSSQLITGNIIPEQRGAIQEILRAGMMRGDNPRTTALDIVGRTSKFDVSDLSRPFKRQGGVIGLTTQQAEFVTNAADDLLNMNPRYFDRKLRDKRFDKIVRQSFEDGKPLPKATRDRIVARYEAKMLKHRADTIARTETLAAVNEARDEALRQILDEGLAPRNAVTRIWRHSFGPNARDGHVMMNQQRRGIDEAFTNPLTGAVLIHPGAGPASEVINCRCYLEHDIDFVAVELAA